MKEVEKGESPPSNRVQLYNWIGQYVTQSPNPPSPNQTNWPPSFILDKTIHVSALAEVLQKNPQKRLTEVNGSADICVVFCVLL